MDALTKIIEKDFIHQPLDASMQRRIRDLRKRGVIERIAALVEPSLVGHPVTVIVDV